MREININFQYIIIGVSIILAALVFLFSARGFSNQGKYVEVKGLSEQIVKADRAIWSIGFEVKSNNSDELYGNVDRNVKAITQFLTKYGFEDSEINVAPVNVYQDTYRDAQFRYNANIQMSVYTDKVDAVRTAMQETVPLLQQGIVFSNNYVDFQFTDLNSIKPEMLAEAIAHARTSAEQFAHDSGTQVGVIARANQGVFSIEEKDPGSPEYKKVRVVSTLRFLLN